jgi:hypothetical protein
VTKVAESPRLVLWAATWIALLAVAGVALLAGDLRAATFSILELVAVAYGVLLGFALHHGFVRRAEREAATRRGARHARLESVVFDAVRDQWGRAHDYWNRVSLDGANERTTMLEPRTSSADWAANRDEFLAQEDDPEVRTLLTRFFGCLDRFTSLARAREDLLVRGLPDQSFQRAARAVDPALADVWKELAECASQIAGRSGDEGLRELIRKTLMGKEEGAPADAPS